MKLLMFELSGDRRLGALRPGHEQELVDLSPVAHDLLALIDAGEEGLDEARRSIIKPAGAVHSLESVKLLPPLDPPRGNIIAIGRNYQKHAEETAAANHAAEPPTVFTKAITSITGPTDDYQPALSPDGRSLCYTSGAFGTTAANPSVDVTPLAIDQRLAAGLGRCRAAHCHDRRDGELSPLARLRLDVANELGRRGANIDRQNGFDHVFGYMVINDVSARDIQMGWGGQYFKGKSLDRSSPIGPWVVTRDEIPEPQRLGLALRVNGQLKQDGNTRDMIYPVDALVEWTSKGMTLLPGAIIATGTPDGVGFARTPPEFLKPGDAMETEVEGIGALTNRIVGYLDAAG